MSIENQDMPVDGDGRRRRRRRRRRGGGGDGPAEGGASVEVEVSSGDGEPASRGRRQRRVYRDDFEAAGVSAPASGKMVVKPRTHRTRWKPSAGLARRRRFSRGELDELAAYFAKMPEPLVMALYRSLGGQPIRGGGGDPDRVVQLTVRALAQGNRLSGLLFQLQPRDRQALAVLIQCGGLAPADEFHRELVLMLGGREGDWARTMQVLGDRGIVAASAPVEDGFYYLVPEPLVDPLLEHLGEEMALPTFEHDDIRVVDQRPFCPPLDFSLATLATWMDQHPPKLTQRQEVFKAQKEDLDKFFAQLWAAESEVFQLHYDFLMMHGMIELRGDRVSVNRDVVEEWLSLEPDDQRDLMFRALEKRMGMAEWVLWAVHSAKGQWVPEAPLMAIYRRWRRGEDWRERFHKGLLNSTRGNEREGYSFSALVNCGMLELGVWGQQKVYRLSPRGTALLDPPEDEGFSKFYLTPNYEIIAPAGLAPVLLFRLGELAELMGCDRANTYKITEISIEQALKKGWRREELLEFLREYSQIGLPQNVESTIRAWMGGDGDVEFHEVTALTVHRAHVRRFESMRAMRSFVLHRFAPGLYAVDRKRLPEITIALMEAGFNPGKDIRRYPGDQEAAQSRERLHHQLAEARELREDPVSRAQRADTLPEDLNPVPGSTIAHQSKRRQEPRGPARASIQEVRAIIEKALKGSLGVELSYHSIKDDTRKMHLVVPERIALNREGASVLVALDVESGNRLSYALAQIERARTTDKKVGES